MKIIVFCEKCGNATEFKPETVGKLANVQTQLEDRFLIDRDHIEVETSTWFTEPISNILSTKIEDEEVLEDQILESLEIESELKSLRIDCQNCGDYIVLTDFNY